MAAVGGLFASFQNQRKEKNLAGRDLKLQYGSRELCSIKFVQSSLQSFHGYCQRVVAIKFDQLQPTILSCSSRVLCSIQFVQSSLQFRHGYGSKDSLHHNCSYLAYNLVILIAQGYYVSSNLFRSSLQSPHSYSSRVFEKYRSCR